LWPLCQISAANVAQISASNPRLFALENVALFPRGKHSEHGLAVSGKKSALISRNCSEIGRGQKAPVVSVSVRQCEAGPSARPLILARIFRQTAFRPLYFVARHLNSDHVREQDR